jgi:hypothetical protein
MEIPQGFDKLIGELGLQKQRSVVSYLGPALGVFAAGLIVGGALALLLAPKSGRELRSEIQKRMRRDVDGDNGARGVEKEKSHA